MAIIGGSEVSYRSLVAEEESTLLSAYKEWLPGGERVGQYFTWRRSHLQASGGVYPTIALMNGKLIGSVSAVPVDVTLNGRNIRASWQQDSMVGPDARGKGVGKTLVEQAAGGYELLLAKGTTPQMYALRKSVGFKDVPLRTFLTAVLRLSASGRFARRGVFSALYLWQEATNRGTAESLTSTRIASFTEEYDSLANRAANAPTVGQKKSAAYLNWRYLTCPTRKYTIWEARDARTLRGAVVVRINDHPGAQAWLVDLVCDPRDKEAADVLVRTAVREAKAAGAPTIRAFVSSRALRRTFRRRGFIDTGETPQFTYRVERQDLAGQLAAADWSFFWGDGDAELY
jgi:GNAT superfamily N-acetyltransferase